jgi:hypothetical protein
MDMTIGKMHMTIFPMGWLVLAAVAVVICVTCAAIIVKLFRIAS